MSPAYAMPANSNSVAEPVESSAGKLAENSAAQSAPFVDAGERAMCTDAKAVRNFYVRTSATGMRLVPEDPDGKWEPKVEWAKRFRYAEELAARGAQLVAGQPDTVHE